MDKCLCSKEDMGVLIGTLCGDCGRKRNSLYCGQSVKQKEWFEYKKARFEKSLIKLFKNINMIILSITLQRFILLQGQLI